ncbi:hypothetical protein F3Y22_tig00111311pilonHSYRG00337 [Hibiscus syriacus]|uniref:Fe2OG dioxygenase domain-containing protein n=1 Tax=Hibiscus syriacus TaxID=106335 RepID=A0A6A2YQZ2_HIBSY|nr:hypothetical protein F3Y22_tig00111311pilonHSYRG00337 [Hibiscus syriacus]
MKPLLTDLVSSVSSVPPNFIRPESDRPNLHDVISDHCIPVVDLQHLDGPNRSTVVKAIGEACQDYGFFLVKNHGLSNEVIDKMTHVSKEFFRLPEKERLKNYSDDPMKTTRLPKKDTSEYCKNTRRMALRLLEAISESLELEKDYINSALGKHAQHMAINYYPKCPEPKLTYGLPGHADRNAVTILLQDHVPGLQVLKDEKWIAVNPIPYTFSVNIGDQIQVYEIGQGIEQWSVQERASPGSAELLRGEDLYSDVLLPVPRRHDTTSSATDRPRPTSSHLQKLYIQ